jgi:hypothetical protein
MYQRATKRQLATQAMAIAIPMPNCFAYICPRPGSKTESTAASPQPNPRSSPGRPSSRRTT